MWRFLSPMSCESLVHAQHQRWRQKRLNIPKIFRIQNAPSAVSLTSQERPRISRDDSSAPEEVVGLWGCLWDAADSAVIKNS